MDKRELKMSGYHFYYTMEEALEHTNDTFFYNGKYCTHDVFREKK